ncbi:hypothetical protein TcYC6_0005250 [Trypanosoma cruzi]|nr:hypothetical protein TcYC6_0005250 [Trypanosoma cruzi]
MAMMMTGRVLLVCALCVLWCGAGGGFGEEGVDPSSFPPAGPTDDGTRMNCWVKRLAAPAERKPANRRMNWVKERYLIWNKQRRKSQKQQHQIQKQYQHQARHKNHRRHRKRKK